MAVTDSSAMIDPEVWADMVQAEFQGRTVMAGLAATDDTLEGSPGSTVSFGRFNALSDAADVAENDPLVPEAMSTQSGDLTIKEAGKAVELTDKSRLISLGDPQQEATRQVGITVARKIDTDLISAATGSGQVFGTRKTVTGSGTFNWELIVNAFGEFGDEAVDTSAAAGLVIHSQEKTAVWKDDMFLSADKIGQGNQILRTGQFGEIGGVPVFVSDRVTAGQAILVLNGALVIAYKRRPVVEQDRDILARSNVITTNVHYVAAALDADQLCLVNVGTSA